MILRLYIICILILGAAFSQSTWLETTQQDFADGVFERNIYASQLDGGTVEFVPRFDLNNDGYLEIVTCDIGGPYVRVYWGGASGYSSSNSVGLLSTGAGDCDIADLNGDGYADFVVTHANSDSRLAIYWGSSTGPSASNVFNFPLAPDMPNEVSYVADLNKDGYLDIVIGTYNNLSVGAIFWGSDSGYSSLNLTTLPNAYASHNTEVADLNKDNWLDIIYVNNYSSVNYIYWGGPSGYSSFNMTPLSAPYPTPHGSSVADLDGDGYLDLIFSSVYGSYSYLYYGSAGGYLTYQALNTYSAYGGNAVCDLDSDGYLDIVFFRGWPSPLRPIIYWGSAAGYSDLDKTEVGIPMYGDGGFVADLDSDGDYDMVVNSRSSSSAIFHGPDFSSSTVLPVNNDHHALFREIGNVYNRQYYEDYSSSVFDADSTVDWGTVEWDAMTPTGTAIEFWVRSGETPVPDATWSDWTSILNAAPIPDDLNARYLQYKVHLGYLNPCYLPSLQEVRITYGGPAAIAAELRINPRTVNLDSQGKFTAFIWLPGGYSNYDIDVSTIQCQGANASSGHATPKFFIAKFDVQDLVGVVPGAAVEFVLTGQLFDGTGFVGADTVRVIGGLAGDVVCQPNPFKSSTVMSFPNTSGAAATVKVYDISGKVVRSFDRTNYQEGRSFVVWDRMDDHGRRLPAGVYFVRGEGEKAAFSEKIIIMD